MPESCYHTKPLQFHGRRTFFAFAIKAEMPVNTWLSGAQEWISKSSGFFDGRPVVLDKAQRSSLQGLSTFTARSAAAC